MGAHRRHPDRSSRCTGRCPPPCPAPGVARRGRSDTGGSITRSGTSWPVPRPGGTSHNVAGVLAGYRGPRGDCSGGASRPAGHSQAGRSVGHGGTGDTGPGGLASRRRRGQLRGRSRRPDSMGGPGRTIARPDGTMTAATVPFARVERCPGCRAVREGFPGPPQTLPHDHPGISGLERALRQAVRPGQRCHHHHSSSRPALSRRPSRGSDDVFRHGWNTDGVRLVWMDGRYPGMPPRTVAPATGFLSLPPKEE